MSDLTPDEEFWVTETGKEMSQIFGKAWAELQKDLDEPPEGFQWVPVVREVIKEDDGGATISLGAELSETESAI